MAKVTGSKMVVLKRDGRAETVHFDKITSRIEKLCYNLASEYLDVPSITLKVGSLSLLLTVTLRPPGDQWPVPRSHHR